MAWYSAIGETFGGRLFLNILTPGLSGNRAVMVWLHGGGWTAYSGTAPGSKAPAPVAMPATATLAPPFRPKGTASTGTGG